MDIKYKAGIAVVALSTSFAVGRYTVPEKIKEVTKTVEVEKKDEDKHKVTHTTKDTKTDGETIVDQTVTEDTVKHETDNKDSSSTKQVTAGESKVTISALAGLSIPNSTPVYGLAVTKPILGPLTIGLFGLSNGTCGASLGLTF